MSDGILLSRRSAQRLLVGLATFAAFALTVEGTIGERQAPIDLRGAIPQTLRPDDYVVGKPWTGEAAIVETVATLEARSARAPKYAGPARERRHEQSGEHLKVAKRHNP